MEDYKEKYEHALNRAKVINPGTADYEVTVKIFPELKESEDERIRKEIIRVLKGEISYTLKEENEKYIAWLEKQDKQKPAAYFYCKYGGVMPLCSDCKRNHLNSKYKTEEIETWMIPALRCTKQCFSYIQQKPTRWSEEDEEIIKCLNNCLDELEEKNGWHYIYVNYKNVELNKIRNWLKSLKERME